MSNFFDLPKDVRELIYRMALVRDEKITLQIHQELVRKCRVENVIRKMPPLCQISKKAEEESAPIYYGENHFCLQGASFSDLCCMTSLRNVRRIRRITLDWPIGESWEYEKILTMRNLEELCLGVDEVAMVASVFKFRHHDRRGRTPEAPSPQQQLTLLRHPGMSSMLAFKNLKKVDFVKRYNSQSGGPIPGGYLETVLRPRMLASAKGTRKPKTSKRGFPFLDMPPEIRNRIYGLVLAIDGPIHPSPGPPSSAPRRKDSHIDDTQQSALCLLQVNQQIHNEAFALFYHCNTFEFYYPTQLSAFVMSLSPPRQISVRSITLHYQNRTIGGIEIIDLTISLLRQLSGLRRLHIIGRGDLVSDATLSPYRLRHSNPVAMPGMRALFSLRGISDIKVRDTEIESELRSIKEKNPNLQFEPGSPGFYFVSLEKIIAHFNAALVEAQAGNVNQKMLDDNKWHMKEPYPTV